MVKIRNKSENVDYTRYLKAAIDDIKQASDSITYTSFPEVNRRTIAQLKNAISTLEAMMSACVFKP